MKCERWGGTESEALGVKLWVFLRPEACADCPATGGGLLLSLAQARWHVGGVRVRRAVQRVQGLRFYSVEQETCGERILRRCMHVGGRHGWHLVWSEPCLLSCAKAMVRELTATQQELLLGAVRGIN